MPSPSDLEFQAVTKTFGRNRVLRSLDLTVPAGSFLALMGANGAGKTTLLRIGAGLAQPTAGTVTLAGIDLRKAGAGLRRRIGWVSHESLLYPELTGRANLAFHAGLFGLADPADRIAQLSRVLDLDRILDRPAGELSRGNRQRLTLARAMLHGPEVLLLDEPFTGLDEASAERLVELLQQIHATGRSVVLTIHERARLLDGPNRVVVVEGGVIASDERVRPALVRSESLVYAGGPARSDSHSPESGMPEGHPTESPSPNSMLPGQAPTGNAIAPSDLAELAERPALIAPPGLVGAALAIATKDLRVEWRSRDMLGSAGLFSLIVLVTASFTTPPGGGAQGVTTGILWISLLFAVMLGVGRTMSRESTDRAIEGLMLAPIARESVLVGKVIAGMVMMSAIELFVVPMFMVLVTSQSLNSDVIQLIVTVLLATFGLVTVSTLFSGIAAGSRIGDTLLPLIVMPIVIPLMIAAVETTRRALGGAAAAGATGVPQWLGLLAGFDLIVALAGLATFAFVMEEQ